MDDRVADLLAFLDRSPTPYHAVAEAVRRLHGAGFRPLREDEVWSLEPDARRYVVRAEGSLVAFQAGRESPAEAGFRILGAHTDSPNLRLKPRPDKSAEGYRQLAVEPYGSPLLYTWLDRELSLAGRVSFRDGNAGAVRTALVDFARPLLRIPSLAIHLDREVNSKGLTLDKQRHTQPIWGAAADLDADADVLAVAIREAGIESGDVVGHDLLVADTQAPARFGLADAFFAAGRMDNLSSVYAGLVALLAAPDDAAHISVLAAFDHEELGSQSRSGASGPVLEDVLVRVSAALGAGEIDRRRAFAASWILSSDAGHAVHPNYSERHDPANRPVLGGGPLLKLNSNQKYASDAVGSALWADVCRRAGVATQAFVSNNAIPCGSTIGPLAATRLGIRTVDVGVPLLSMHSARELAHVDDLAALGAAVSEFFASA